MQLVALPLPSPLNPPQSSPICGWTGRTPRWVDGAFVYTRLSCIGSCSWANKFLAIVYSVQSAFRVVPAPWTLIAASVSGFVFVPFRSKSPGLAFHIWCLFYCTFAAGNSAEPWTVRRVIIRLGFSCWTSSSSLSSDPESPTLSPPPYPYMRGKFPRRP